MSLSATLLRSAGLLALALLASCGNSVNLDPGNRGVASKMRIEPQVGRPEKFEYTDRGSNAAAWIGFPFGLVGGLAGAAIQSGMNSDNKTELEGMTSSTVGDPAKAMRTAMAAALQKKKVTTVTDANASSSLKLEFKRLGLLPLEQYSVEMQLVMEVEATLTANNGSVIWKTHYGSYPHNDQLPVRTMEQYRSNPSLFGQDFQATCRYVADQLADDLKSQMSDE